MSALNAVSRSLVEYTEADLFTIGGHVIMETLRNAVRFNDVDKLARLMSERIVECLSRSDMNDLYVEALAQEKFEALLYLTKTLSSHKNFKLCDPVLIIALQMRRSDDFIIKLAELWKDVNQRDAQLRIPLHLAVQRDTLKVAELFIARGADVDARDCEGCTPMHYAVQASKTDAVCMLLYYDANPNEVSVFTRITPFMASLCSNNRKIQEILINYVTDFNLENLHGQNTLYLALKHKSPFCTEILTGGAKMGNNINLLFTDMEIFHIMWPMISRTLLSRQRFPLLKKLLGRSNIPREEFMHYLYSLLTWKHADFLVQQYAHAPNKFQFSLFADIADTLQEYNIEITERLSIFYLLLSMGAPVYKNDLYRIYKCFGYNEEFEAMMIVNPDVFEDNLFHNVSPFLECVCFNDTNALKKFHCDLESMLDMCHLLKFYMLDQKFKTEFRACSEIYINIYGQCPHEPYQYIIQALKRTNVPTLLQLSRNTVREIIYSNNQQSNKLLNFYDNIKTLPVPNVIKEYLLLKRPLY